MPCNDELLDGRVLERWFRVPVAQLPALASFVDQLPVPIAVLECSGQVCYANSAARANLHEALPQVRRAVGYLCPWARSCPDKQNCARKEHPAARSPVTLKAPLDSNALLEVVAAWLSPENPGLVLATWAVRSFDPATPAARNVTMSDDATPRHSPASSRETAQDLLAQLDAVQANAETTARFARAEGDSLCGELATLQDMSHAFLGAGSRLAAALEHLEQLLVRLQPGQPEWGEVHESLAQVKEQLSGHLSRGALLYESVVRAIDGSRRVSEVAVDVTAEASSLAALALHALRSLGR